MLRKVFFIILSLMTITSCTTGSPRDSFVASKDASATPYGKYEKTITYTLGNLTGDKNSNMPSGDSYENNAYTRYLKKMLNVQNKDVFEAYDKDYTSSVEHAILSKKIPDVMMVENTDDLEYLIKNDMIEDLTTAYRNCTTDRIKAMYNSYGSSIMDMVTYHGKLYAMPETNIDDGPNLFWCRSDWLRELHLKAPKTLSDVEHIVKVFQKKKHTDGLLADTSLTAGTGYSSEYLLNLYFARAKVYPKQWLKSNGKITYGSINPNAKKVLAHLHKLYKEGILDRNFLLRTSANITQEIIDEKCGAFFGPWWVPNNPLVDAVKKNPQAKWAPYRIATSKDGTTSYHSINPSTKYVVVRKGFKHPEVIFKIISVIFDYLRYENKNVSSINRYYALNVDPTARPIAINVDYANALSRSYQSITHILEGGKITDDISSSDVSYAGACQDYLANKRENRAENWAAYTTRIEALKLLDTKKIQRVQCVFFGSTPTSEKKGYYLSQLEQDTYLKIISGKLPVNSFDDFVLQWKMHGGDQITKEVTKYNQSKS